MLVGSLFSNSWTDVWIILVVVIFLILFVILSYKQLFSMTFDLNYAKFSKINVTLFDFALTIVTAVLVVIGVQTIGTLLISAFIIFPSVSSGLIAKSFKNMIIISLIINVTASLIGIVSAHYLSLPAGSVIIVLHGFIFLFIYLYKKVRRIE